MSSRRPLTWLDVFTDTPLAGNGLAVVGDADGLDAPTMLAVARETGLSETTFVQTATRAGADYRNRIFTVVEELPFAGHPSLGTAVAVAHARGLAEARFVQETVAGLQPLEVRLDGRAAHASMLQEPASFGPTLEAGSVLTALGLDAVDAHAELPVQAVSTGVFHLMVPVHDRAALARAAPALGPLQAVTSTARAVVLYAFALGDDAGATVTARGFFAGRDRVVEDPATGSAAGPLGAYLDRYAGRRSVTVEQGAAIDRPSRIDVAMEGERVRVGGDCVIVVEGEITL